MNRTYALIVVLGVGLLVGGCVGQQPSDSVTTTSFDYPAGYNESGITNATVAVDSHKAALDESYRVQFSLEQVSDRGRSRVNGTVAAAPDRNRARLQTHATVAGRTSSLNEFRTGSVVYQQDVSGTSFKYYVENRSFEQPVYVDRTDFVTMIDSLEMNATNAYETNGTRYVEYSVENVSPNRIQTKIYDANGTVVVASNGQIHRMSVAFTQRVSGVERDVSFTYNITTGNVTVERPSWVETAKNSNDD